MNFSHQNSTRGEKISSAICVLLALSLLSWSVADFVSIANKGGSYLMIFGKTLLAFAKGIAGAILIAPSLTRWAMSPLFRCIDWIYSPGGYARRPPLDYRLADLYRRERKFDDAIERYSEILRYYPKEVSAHAWLFVLVDETQGASRSRRIWRNARRRLWRTESWKEFEELVAAGRAEWR